jgi:hypothetical protein
MKKTKSAPPKDVISGRAISIQQPYIEEILLGTKKFEYRSRLTHIRGRVYLYASKKHGDESRWKKLGLEPGDLPSGLIVGSVEIVGCKYFESDDYYGYKLKNPIRYKTPIKPENHPQPCFFFPFGEIKSRKAA